MYLILAYDISQERVSKVMKICREYLNHVQNSLFEGNITSSNYKQLKIRLSKTIDSDVDAILIYELWSDFFKREIIGVEKKDRSNII